MNPFQTSLVGTRLELRLLSESDREALFQAASDPLIWEMHPQKNRFQRPVFDLLFERLLTHEGPMAVLDRSTSSIIGTSSFYDHSPEESLVCVGYTFLIRACWGGGYNREMKSLMLDHAFRFVDRVHFHVGAGNLRSQGALRKIGARFMHEESRKMEDGSEVRSQLFEIRR